MTHVANGPIYYCKSCDQEFIMPYSDEKDIELCCQQCGSKKVEQVRLPEIQRWEDRMEYETKQ